MQKILFRLFPLLLVHIFKAQRSSAITSSSLKLNNDTVRMQQSCSLGHGEHEELIWWSQGQRRDKPADPRPQASRKQPEACSGSRQVESNRNSSEEQRRQGNLEGLKCIILQKFQNGKQPVQPQENMVLCPVWTWWFKFTSAVSHIFAENAPQ